VELSKEVHQPGKKVKAAGLKGPALPIKLTEPLSGPSKEQATKLIENLQL
jgi:hypothetical protein